MKLHVAGEDAIDHPRHVFGLERVVDLVVAHAAARDVLHLGVLHVKPRVREQRAVAAVVIMHVRDDHVLHARMRDAGGLEAFLDRVDDLALSPLRHRAVEARVDHDRAAVADDRPDEVVERHVGIFVRVAIDEIAPGFAANFCVLDRENLVGRRAHDASPVGDAAVGRW
jgi:hypothetical protein